jgi:hypothetical protein
MQQEQKGARFEQMRQQQREHQLTDAERAELALLTRELEAAEATYLTPAAERLRQERETLETQNRTLEALANRKEALVRRLREFLSETQSERRRIEGELAAVLAGSRGSQTDE